MFFHIFLAKGETDQRFWEIIACLIFYFKIMQRNKKGLISLALKAKEQKLIQRP